MTDRILAPAPRALVTAGVPALGRFDGPIADVNLPRFGLSRFRLKEWHYTSVTTERTFFAVAIVQLGYVANAFAYVVDRSRPHRPHALELVMPLGRGVEFADSSVRGVTRLSHGANRVEAHMRPDGFRLDVALELDGTELVAGLDCTAGRSASIAHRLAHGGTAYTHKGTLYEVAGHARWGSLDLLSGEALGTIDWTRSEAARRTVWRWASFAGRSVDGQRVGLNLSADVYDDANGDSVENFAYDDGGVTALAGVDFEVPRAPRHMPWRLRSRGDDSVDLSFEPLGARAQNLAVGVVESRFIQPYGHFYGRLRDHRIDGVFGVVEDHQATW